MLRAAAMISVSALGATGCLWEPIQLTPDGGNEDAAPVIQIPNPDSSEVLLLPSGGDACVATVGLFSVYSPQGKPLQASFFLNFDSDGNPATRAAPLSIEGQTQFDLQESQPGIYYLSPQAIHIDDFVSQFNGPTNLLEVFVSDDLASCPNPFSSPPNGETLACYTTSWAWIIEPNRCPILDGF